MKTRITDMLGIEFPIIAFSHCRDVVAAVSKAGGMGVLGAVAHSPESLEVDLCWIEAEVGDRPYGVDVIIPASLAGGPDGGYTLDDVRQLIPATHVDFVDEILGRYEVPPLPEGDSSESLTAFGSLGEATPSRPTRPGRSSRSPSPTAAPSWPTRWARRPST